MVKSPRLSTGWKIKMSTIASVIGKSGLYPEIPAVDVEDVEKLGPINELPEEILLIIFGYLSLRDQDTACCVCRKWRVVGNDETLKEIRDYAFGATKWKRYFGDVGKEPPFPDKMVGILNSRCPFVDGKRVKETHLLVLIPQTVNGKFLTLTTFEELVQNPKTGEKTQYRHHNKTINEEYENQYSLSHWCLMTRDVIPKSRGKTYCEQKDLIASYVHEGKPLYTIPTALDAVISILVHYVSTGERLYSDNPETYTRGQETVHSNERPMTIGHFDTSGLVVYCRGLAASYEMFGVSGSRKLLYRSLVFGKLIHDRDNDQSVYGGEAVRAGKRRKKV